jgi:Pyruvate/2-oxoacid:ferredoxin oxidoreductase gamma subunit
VVQPFTQLADSLGDPRAGNMVLLGALLAVSGALDPEPVDHALTRLVKSERWIELDRRAIARGRDGVAPPGHS